MGDRNDTVKEAYQRFCDGDPLNDEQLDALTEHMTRLEELLLPLGPRFFLPRKEISGVARTCRGFKNERKNG